MKHNLPPEIGFPEDESQQSATLRWEHARIPGLELKALRDYDRWWVEYRGMTSRAPGRDPAEGVLRWFQCVDYAGASKALVSEVRSWGLPMHPQEDREFLEREGYVYDPSIPKGFGCWRKDAPNGTMAIDVWYGELSDVYGIRWCYTTYSPSPFTRLSLKARFSRQPTLLADFQKLLHGLPSGFRY